LCFWANKEKGIKYMVIKYIVRLLEKAKQVNVDFFMMNSLIE
jgi:hypothetical protein